MLRRATFARVTRSDVPINNNEPVIQNEMDKVSDGKVRKKSASPPRKSSSPTRSAQKSGSSPPGKSPTREKSLSPNRKKSAKADKGSAKRRTTPSPKDKVGRGRNRSKSPKSGKDDDGRNVKKTKKVTVKTPEVNLNDKGFKIVDQSGQGLTTIPASLLSKDIGELCLASNNLRNLPLEIKKWTNLSKLDISKNGLKCTHSGDFSGIPKEISQLEQLEELRISECNLPFIPPAIWRLTKLKYLDASRNKMNNLPPEIGNMEALVKLNLQQTNISTLPPEIAYCQDLEEILLWGNVIESLPETLPEMPKLKTLALNYRSFCTVVDPYMENMLKRGQIKSEHIPVVVFELPALHILDLECTKVNTLPDIYNISLKEFYLCKNFLQTIPDSVYGLKYLSVLDLSDNLLSALPEELGRLKSLTVLRATNNKFSKIPQTFGHLQCLKELNLSENKLKCIPTEIKGMSSLKYLLLQKNEIGELPDEICELSNLKTLDVTGNQIKTLPVKLHQLTSITAAHSYRNFRKYGLWLSNNPLEQPPPEIWKTINPERIFDYLKKLQILKADNLQRQKLLVLGESQSGKTSLVHALVEGKSILSDEKSEATRLLTQQKWVTVNSVEFLVNDFGGDEIYHFTYPLFLDEKALVLIVFDLSKYLTDGFQNCIGHWLETICLHIPGAVVKIVGTKSDLSENVEEVAEKVKDDLTIFIKNRTDILLEELDKINEMLLTQDSSSDISGATLLHRQNILMKLTNTPLKIQPHIDCVSSDESLSGISQLTENVELLAINEDLFPSAQKYVPTKWLKLKEKIKQNKLYFTDMENVKTIGEQMEIEGSELEECLEYLNDIGDIYWYYNNKKINDLIFHKPRILIEILSCLYRHDIEDFLVYEENKIFMSKGNLKPEDFYFVKEMFLNNGQVTRQMLHSLWFYQRLNNDAFTDFLHILPLLNICYVIPEPDVPVGKHTYRPLIVLPSFKEDAEMNEPQEIWKEDSISLSCSLKIVYSFPLQNPTGLFERISSQLQNVVSTRLDSTNYVYGSVDTSSVLLYRQFNTINSIGVDIISEDDNQLKTFASEIIHVIADVLQGYPGLYWDVTVDSDTKDQQLEYTNSCLSYERALSEIPKRWSSG